MDIAVMIGYVLAGTQFIKETLSKLKITVQGTGAVILSIVVSLAVVFYGHLGTAFSLTWITDFIQVVIAANMGYKVFAGKGTTT